MAGIAIFGTSQAHAGDLGDNKLVRQAASALLAIEFCGTDETAGRALADSLVSSAAEETGVDHDSVVDAVEDSITQQAQDSLLFQDDHTQWCNEAGKP